MASATKNALGTEMLDHIDAELARAGGAPVLLTGGGDAFSAGLDLREVASLDAPGMKRFLDKLEGVCARLFDYPGPTVAAVNGHAIAGGCVLTICCDLRVCTSSPRARIGLNEVALGLRFPPGIAAIVRARVPPRSVAEVVLGAGLHAPEDARRLGLVDELADDVAGVAARAPRHARRAPRRRVRRQQGDAAGRRHARERRRATRVLRCRHRELDRTGAQDAHRGRSRREALTARRIAAVPDAKRTHQRTSRTARSIESSPARAPRTATSIAQPPATATRIARVHSASGARAHARRARHARAVTSAPLV